MARALGRAWKGSFIMMLNERSIVEALRETVSSIERGQMNVAANTLEVLEFERFLSPIPNPTKGSRILFVDPASDFGVERVHETGAHVRSTRAALARGDGSVALEFARKALERWSAPER